MDVMNIPIREIDVPCRCATPRSPKERCTDSEQVGESACRPKKGCTAGATCLPACRCQSLPKCLFKTWQGRPGKLVKGTRLSLKWTDLLDGRSARLSGYVEGLCPSWRCLPPSGQLPCHGHVSRMHKPLKSHSQRRSPPSLLQRRTPHLPTSRSLLSSGPADLIFIPPSFTFMSRVGSGLGGSPSSFTLWRRKLLPSSHSVSPLSVSPSLCPTPLSSSSPPFWTRSCKKTSLARVVKDLDEPAHPAGPPTYSATTSVLPSPSSRV